MCGADDNLDSIVTKIFIYLVNGQRMGEFQYGLLGFKPIPECATLDSHVSDQERICDFIYRV